MDDRWTPTDSGWTEDISQTFLNIADVAVPARREQIDTLCSLIPASPDEPFSAVDLCCGEGLLSQAVVERFPEARLLALDGSPKMLAQARRRLAPFSSRAEVRPFDLHRRDWLNGLPSPIRCVLSSLALHHLDDEGKRTLFRQLAGKLEPGGALLIADVVTPAGRAVHEAWAQAWHRIARQQSLDLTGSLETYEKAVAEGWSYPNDELDPLDTPSGLLDQLKWLEQAGLSSVDCFWLRAGHAIYGGYR